MKNILGLLFIAVLIAIPFVKKERAKNQVEKDAYAHAESLCGAAVRTALLPEAQKTPGFISFSTHASAVTPVEGGYVVRVLGNVSTISKPAPNFTYEADYKRNCQVADGQIVEIE